MKQLIVGIFIMTLIFVTGCSVQTNETTTTSTGQVTTTGQMTTTTDQMTTTTDEVTTTTQEVTTTTQEDHDDVYISFSSWGDPTFEQKMIDKFEERYPWIHVYLDTSIQGSGAAFTENLVAAAANGTIPDVFAVDNVPTAISNNLTYDIQPLWEADPDTDKVYDNIAQTGLYGDVRYAAPSYQFIKGVYLNKTILADEGLDLPSYNWTYHDMIDLATMFSDPNNYMYGMQGQNFTAYLPYLDNPELGYGTYDGEKFNYNSQAYIDAANLEIQLRNEGVIDIMTGDEKEVIFGQSDAWPFYEGHTLMAIDGSWNLQYLIDGMVSKGYDIGFWPYPGGSVGQKIPVVLDFMCVSSQTSYPEASYKLLKWMSFGEEGWKARLEIMQEENIPVTTFPVGDYPEVWSTLREMAGEIDGMQQNIDLIFNAEPDVDKWLPGYSDFFGWLEEDSNPYKEQLPNMTPEQYAPIYEQKMNEFLNTAYAELGLNKDEDN